VVRTVMTEALLIGTAASMIGVAAGLGLALLMRAGFNLVGASLPATALQVEVRSIVAGFVVGLLVTLSAALAPALRASRVSPMAAMRDAPAGDARRSRAIVSTALAAGGAALVLVGLWSSAELGVRFGLIGLGAMLLFVGAAMLTRYLVAPLARVIGAPLAKAGLAGRLGRENAIRNPARTAQTAAALTIGVALVAGVTIFGSSLSATFLGTLDTRVRADLVVLSSSQAPFSSTAAAALAANPALSAVSAWRDGEFRDARDETRGVSALDPDGLGELYDPAVSAGAMSDLARPGTIAVHEDYASENDLEPGSTMTVRFSRTGAVPLRVAAVFTDDTFADFFISLDEYERNYTTQQDVVILARAAEGVSPEDAKAAAEAALTDFPNLDVRTKAEYKDFVAGQIDGLLRVFYVLLAMAVLIAIFGIVLTLALSVFERTREIGLLRAVGLSRASVRAMIRWESVIVSLIGAVVGLALGVFLGAVSVLSVPIVETLSIPWVSLVVFLLAAALLGVLAAILPARRAARLDILDAIRHE
jgi:putative ABC transport system permease protein